MLRATAQNILIALKTPGRHYEVKCSAPTQVVSNTVVEDPEKGATVDIREALSSSAALKPGRLDRWLDKVVEASGSQLVYFALVGALLAWALMGIKFGKAETYKIVISDAQAVVNMVFDAFLMRQQFNSYKYYLTVAACLRSRSSSNKRMLSQLIAGGQYAKTTQSEFEGLRELHYLPELPEENWLGRLSTRVSRFLGHIGTDFAFCLSIIVWLGFGHYCDWSSDWLLYINSATSALMVFMLATIANIRERHNKYMSKCLKEIWKADVALEIGLRAATGDDTVNPSITIPPLGQTKIQRAIDYYADLVGTLAGVVILCGVIVVWMLVGPAFHFNSNWWLVIGTYAGLIGLCDGFVLRNVSTNLEGYADDQFDQVKEQDIDLLKVIGVEEVEERDDARPSFAYRLSVRIGDICSHELMVVSGVILILGLVIGASAMRWTLTGQLLCNVPPSIIESFFTMMLLTGHNVGEAKRRAHLLDFYLRRIKLIAYTRKMAVVERVATHTCEIPLDEGNPVVGGPEDIQMEESE